MEELVKALTKKRLNALVWEILQGNTVRLVSRQKEFFSQSQYGFIKLTAPHSAFFPLGCRAQFFKGLALMPL